MSAEIVDEISDVTPRWLTSVFAAAGIDATVGAITTERVGTGQMGSCYRVLIDYERGDGPDRVVVKLPATDPSARRAGRRGYRCETNFYRQFARRLAVRVPHCYFAEVSRDASAFTLVLEDLAPAEPGDQIAGCTVDEAREAVLNVVGLHGPTWCDPSLRDLDWVIGDVAGVADLVAVAMKDATADFLGQRSLDEVTVGVLEQFVDRYAQWARGRQVPFSLVHGDYRLDNLLFAPAPALHRVIAVDWQVVTVGPPLRDVAFLIATGLQPDDRRTAERELIDAYHGALADVGVSGYGAAQCWDDYRHALFHGLHITVFGASVAQATERGDQMFTVMAERTARAIDELDAFSLL